MSARLLTKFYLPPAPGKFVARPQPAGLVKSLENLK
jgi:hypothetical protein